jgi:acyl carrier protein
MFEKVKNIIEERLGSRVENITKDTDLLADLSINSLELVELVCEFEDEFDIEVPEKEIRRFSKVSDIVVYLESI